ncbi:MULTISPECIES: non-ribosomal peptide synthetase [Nostocales]|nr:non-ribosomal peptide synthetase [Tolypothrix bouteillei]KAF3889903.1 non-ribosomal peptide synthetase [Tolypothrix bouteillei VB521301]
MSSEEVFVFRASFAQQRLWFLDQLIPGNTIYNVPTAIRLTGLLNCTALQQALQEIVCRHETLRTRFGILEGEAVQLISPSLCVPLSTLNLEQLPTEKREIEAKLIVTSEIECPFDLSQGPLLRVKLLVLSETEHILLLNMHHIICDDWSIGVFIRELGTLYQDIVCNVSTSSLPELPLQYADFACWQREWLHGEGTNGYSPLQTQLEYWRQQLKGVSMLHLPTDRPRETVQSYKGETQFLEISQQLADELQILSQQAGVTLFMTLLAAFQMLLYRYTYQEDIVVGSPIANRNRSEVEGLIGFFVNSLVLRTDLSGNPTFRELLARVREVTLGAYSHQDLPFEKLVEELHPDRNLSHHPLFQVVFGFENAPMSALELPGLVPSFMNIDFKTTRFDLELHLWKCSQDFRSLWGGNWEHSDGIRGVIVFNTDLFKKNTIIRFLKHFKTLLKSLVHHPEQCITEIPILSEAERHQILVEWNNTYIEYPDDKCIHQLFEDWVQKSPDAIALVFGDVETTYRELNQRSNQLAHYLQQRGVGIEVLVGICVERSVDAIVGLLAILKAGGVYVPLDPNYPQERLNFILEDAGVSILLVQENTSKQFMDFSQQIIYLDKDWDKVSQESTDNPKIKIDSACLAYAIYTSGSTGKPKGVAVTHKAVNRLVCNTNYITIKTIDKVAQASTMSFDAATFEIWGALLNGAQLVSIDKQTLLSSREFKRQLQEKEISILFLTTALFQQIARDNPQAFASLRCLLFGGETVDVRWVEKVLKQGSPHQLIHVYGPTEGTTFSSYYNVKEFPETTASLPIGRPIANTQIYILDTRLQPVPIGVSGELYISGDGLARGYLKRPNLTAERFIPNPFKNYDQSRTPKQKNPSSRTPIFKTGDLARYLPDGNIEFLGRIDNQVKIRGFRIELGEIEAVLKQHPGVRDSVAIVREEVRGEKDLVAYIITDNQYIDIANHPKSTVYNSQLHELRQFLKQKLPQYMVPKACIVLESFPLTPNGKVDRNALPAPNQLIFDRDEDYLAPRTPVEEVLADIWNQLLGTENLGVCDNFFELGGHSLLATQLVSRIRDVLNVDVSVRHLFEAPTVAELAKYIETMRWAIAGSDKVTTSEGREEIEF